MVKHFEIEVDLDALREEKKQIEQALVNIRKYIKDEREKIKPISFELDKLTIEFGREWDKVWKKRYAVNHKICLMFVEWSDCQGYIAPYYGVNGYSSGITTNIRPEILNAIKRVVPISKLKHSQIENIVRKMIEIELEKSVEYKELCKKTDELRESNPRLREKGTEYKETEEKLGAFREAEYTLENRLDEINLILSNPKKWVNQQEKIKLREWILTPEGIQTILLELKK